MTVEHSPLSVSDPEEDPQAIVVAKPSSSSSSTIMEPMSMNVNDNDDRDDNDNNGLLVMVQGSKGETQQQPPPYRNTCFAITFVGQLFAVTIVALAVGVPRLQQLGGAPTIDNDFVRDDDENGFSGGENGSAGMAVVWIMMMMMMMLVVVLALTAIGLSGLFVYIMSRYSASIVKVVLVASPVVFVLFGWTTLMASNDDPIQQVFARVWFCIALVSVLYASCSWRHRFLASANLTTGLAAVRAHHGIVSVSLLLALLGSVFSIIWCVAVVGVFFSSKPECVNNDVVSQQSIVCPNDFTNLYLFLLLLSYYWTHSTLRVRPSSSSSTCQAVPETEPIQNCDALYIIYIGHYKSDCGWYSGNLVV